MNDGALAGDRSYLQFHRELPHPPSTVWRAILEPHARGTWFFPGPLEAQVDGRVALVESGPGVTGRVREVKAPHVLGMDWNSLDAPGSSVTFTLDDHPHDSTRLHLRHDLNPACHPVALLAGWHAILDDLRTYLATGVVGDTEGRHAQLMLSYGRAVRS